MAPGAKAGRRHLSRLGPWPRRRLSHTRHCRGRLPAALPAWGHDRSCAFPELETATACPQALQQPALYGYGTEHSEKWNFSEWNSSWAISNPERWCCESAAPNMPANLENSAVATGLEKGSFHSNPKERQCQRMLKLPHNCTHLTR